MRNTTSTSLTDCSIFYSCFALGHPTLIICFLTLEKTYPSIGLNPIKKRKKCEEILLFSLLTVQKSSSPWKRNKDLIWLDLIHVQVLGDVFAEY